MVRVRVSVCDWPDWSSQVTEMWSPGWYPTRTWATSSALATCWPPSEVISSPAVRPALAAGEPEMAPPSVTPLPVVDPNPEPPNPEFAGLDRDPQEAGGADVHVGRGGARLDLLGDGHRLVDRDRVGLLARGGLALELEARGGRGVDPDHLAVGVDQRAARVARLDGRVGLDQPG